MIFSAGTASRACTRRTTEGDGSRQTGWARRGLTQRGQERRLVAVGEAVGVLGEVLAAGDVVPGGNAAFHP
jgi:hypothetical protein